jgi:hypothetical protein
MSRDVDDGKTGIFAQSLPGTGGDLLPTDMDKDVEGHQAGEPAEPGTEPATAPIDRRPRTFAASDESDVEGNLFRSGPTTEGEFARRGPGENPHGDR